MTRAKFLACLLAPVFAVFTPKKPKAKTRFVVAHIGQNDAGRIYNEDLINLMVSQASGQLVRMGMKSAPPGLGDVYGIVDDALLRMNDHAVNVRVRWFREPPPKAYLVPFATAVVGDDNVVRVEQYKLEAFELFWDSNFPRATHT